MIPVYNAHITQYKGERLTIKQTCQLMTICRTSQSYLPFEEVSFLKLLEEGYRYIQRCKYPSTRKELNEALVAFNAKYYPFGFKRNNKDRLANGHFKEVSKYTSPRMRSYDLTYSQIERPAFVMLMRACRDYVFSNRDESAEEVLVSKLQKIANVLS